MNICTQLYLKYIINKGLLCSTEKGAQYLVITCKGKESEREYTCKIESLCCTSEADPTL